jgi:hypothetical protein
MMKRSVGAQGFCPFCFLAGLVAPWAFLAAGAVLSLLDLSPYLDKTAAYLMVIGLAVMAASYFLNHFANNVGERHKP